MKSLHTYIRLASLISAMGLAVSAQAASDLTIGVTDPLTGPASTAGIALQQGMQLAADEWNSKGGVEIDGVKRQVKLIFSDSASNPAQGVNAATKLITQDKVNFVIGDAFASSVTLAVMDLSPQYKMPMMSCESVSSAISKKIAANPDKYKYFWKGSFASEAYANTVYETYKELIDKKEFVPSSNKTIAFIVEDTDYGRSNATSTAALFEKAGWKVLSNNAVKLGETNFTAILTKLSFQKPDILVSVFTSEDSGIALSRQFQDVGMKASHFAIYYPIRATFIKGAGTTANGLLWTPLFFSNDLFAKDRAFSAKMEKRFHVDGNGDNASGYDCMNDVLTAYKVAGSTEADKVTAAMAKTSNDGILGHRVFDLADHTIKFGPEFIPIPAVQIQAGKNVLIWPAGPDSKAYVTPSWMK